MFYEDRISIATPEGVTLEATLAGVGSRFVGALIDQLIRTALLLAVFVGLALLGASGTDIFSFAGGQGGWGGAVVAAFVVVLFLVQFAYDVLFEVLNGGRTPGKQAAGLRVVRADGTPVTFVPSAVRNVLRLVDSLPGFYLVGVVAVLATRYNQRLGDLAAGTLVVRERREAAVPLAGAVGGAAAGPWGSPLAYGVEAWDVSAVTADELATVRRFLARRSTLTDEARDRLAHELASRLRPKVVGPPDGLAAERFLEDVAAAKASRT